ncbi:MAG: translation initiation factor IF-2, partial [Bdellovibrionales bacterium]|nr:translation initiation factor IF-2 [Bdellovibrionales bacterium]
MGKIRIYELAKELGVENKVVLSRAADLGFKGKTSHSNSLEDDEADQIRRAVIRVALGEAPEEVTTIRDGSGDRVTVRRKGNIIRRRKEATDPADEAELATEEAVVESPVAAAPEVVKSEPTLDSIFKSKAEMEQESASLKAPVQEEPDPVEVAAEVEVAKEEVLDSPEHEGAAVEAASVEEDRSEIQKSIEVPRKPERGPRILGKIELPKAPVVNRGEKKSAKKKDRSVGDDGIVVIPDTDEDQRGSKRGGKKRSPRDRKSRKKEFSIGELVDYDGSIARKQKKRRSGKSAKEEAEEDIVQKTEITTPKASKRVVRIDEAISVGELAKAMSLKAGELIAKLMDLGMMVTINQLIDLDTATIVAEEFGFQVESASFDESDILGLGIEEQNAAGDSVPRAPVVTVMGHVDHGKTSLLDYIRKTSVVDKEHGGITQHIGAYKAVLDEGQEITFIDTPGHEAFTDMRARGAQITDIVILVVAADDGVMPQTREAIDHAKAAGVSVVVALNKMDKPGVNPDKVKQQLAEFGLQPEDWGGDTMFFPVSALRGDGIRELLEGVLLQAELKELRADPTAAAKGTIIESKQDKQKGMVATVLVQQGTLRVGDSFVAGATSGRVRSMVDYTGARIDEAGPSTPIEITGIGEIPEAGDDFHVVQSDVKARQVAEVRLAKKQRRDQLTAGGGPISFEEFAARAKVAEAAELIVIIKADVQGSLEAVTQSVDRLSGQKVRVKVIHGGIGGITESDVKLAIASKAVIIGFGVRAEPRAARDAESHGVEIRFYRVIY